MATATGLPLLSGPLPYDPNAGQSETACRRCNKEFNILFSRPRRCNHCGYGYCTSCTDFQALMPRNDGGGVSGYEPSNVCAFCIDMLSLTAANKVKLKGQPVAKLKNYMKAYNLPLPAGAVEKDDFVDIIIKARESNGCLPQANEQFYRDNSIPGTPRADRQPSATDRARNFFSRATGGATASAPATPASTNRQPNLPPRPGQNRRTRRAPPAPAAQPQRQFQPPSGTPSANRPTAAPARNNPYQTAPPVFVPPPPAASPPRPNTAPPPAQPPRQPSPAPPPQASSSSGPSSIIAVPTLEDLLELSEDDLSTFTISTLKSILFANHVNAAHAVEKSELVARVKQLVDQERSVQMAAQLRLEQEEKEMKERKEKEEAEKKRKAELQQKMKDYEDKRKQEAEEEGEGESSGTHASAKPSAAAGTFVERGGLCVICQDEDANIVIVDCGHLCLCRNCSEIVMASSRECPLCRTRIITEARLLRIFKT